jgi:hypothetical protein
MHPDPKSPEPQPIIHVSQDPRYINQADGTIRAYYPGEDWYVEGADRAEVSKKLGDEIDRRMADPEYLRQHFELAQRHLNGEVTPGFEVNTISQEQYEQRTTELGDRLQRP